MVQKGKQVPPTAQAASDRNGDSIPFGRANWLFFGAGLLAVILGFVTLALGSDTLSPILLVLGYCVIIPVAIIWRDKRKTDD